MGGLTRRGRTTRLVTARYGDDGRSGSYDLELVEYQRILAYRLFHRPAMGYRPSHRSERAASAPHNYATVMDTPGAIRTSMKVLSLTSWPSRVSSRAQ